MYEGFVFILTLKIGQIFTRSQKGMAMHDYDYAWLCIRKNKSFECGIVINCFENVYCQMCIRLNAGVLLIRFNSIEYKTWFLYTSSWNICKMNFYTIQRRYRDLLLYFKLDARISNILIFMCHFLHQTKKVYSHSLISNVVCVF